MREQRAKRGRQGKRNGIPQGTSVSSRRRSGNKNPNVSKEGKRGKRSRDPKEGKETPGKGGKDVQQLLQVSQVCGYQQRGGGGGLGKGERKKKTRKKESTLPQRRSQRPHWRKKNLIRQLKSRCSGKNNGNAKLPRKAEGVGGKKKLITAL